MRVVLVVCLASAIGPASAAAPSLASAAEPGSASGSGGRPSEESPEPALLVDPWSARAASGPAAVEAWLWMGRPDRALERIREAGMSWAASTRLRLAARARIASGDHVSAERRIDALAAEPGWAATADALRAELERARARSTWTRIGLGLYAAALAALVLGGGRALVRLHRGTLWALAALFAALVAARLGAPPFTGVVGVLGAGLVGLAHAAEAARGRGPAGPRGRALLAALVLLGALGQGIALVGRFGAVTLYGRALGLEEPPDAS